VPENLRERVQEIAIERFPGSSVTWHEEGQGFIVLKIPESDYGSMQDLDSNGFWISERLGGFASGRDCCGARHPSETR
jgi:hypothetical protein